MPELPEVESVRRQLEPELSGRRVLAVWADTQRRFHAPDRLLGRRVEAVGRRGKFLLCPLDQGLELVLHLGMTGVLHFGAADARLVGLDQLPAYALSPGLAGFLAGIGCWPKGAPVPDDLPVPPSR